MHISTSVTNNLFMVYMFSVLSWQFLLLGFLGQEGFVGFLVGVGSFLFHLGCEFTDFSRDLELAPQLGTSKY